MIMRIAAARMAAGLSQQELASRMGVAPTAISNWEHEVALPRARQLPMLAKAVGCSIDELFAQPEPVCPM